MPNPDLVSVIIPLYNAKDYLAETINSALNQTWTNIEIILVDDGSTDNSFEIAQSFTDRRITLLQQANSGASAARNLGLKHARGKYIQFLDADDLLSSNKIAVQVASLNGSDELIALGDTVHFSDGSDPFKVLPTKEWYQKDDTFEPVDFLLKLYMGTEIMPGYGGMIQPNAWLTPSGLIKKAGNWNEFRCPDDDGEFFCRIILASNGVVYTPGCVNYYRKYTTGQSLSGQRDREAVKNMLLAIDLKYSHIKKRTDSTLVDQIFARHYWDLGVNSYPLHKDISNKAIKQAQKMGYRGPKYVSGKLSMFMSQIVGWRMVKLLSYLKHGV